MSVAGQEDASTRCIWEEKPRQDEILAPWAPSQHKIVKNLWFLKENPITVLDCSKMENEEPITQGEDLLIVMQILEIVKT